MSRTRAASGGARLALKATKDAPPGMAVQAAGPQGGGATFHSNPSPMEDCSRATCQEPDTYTATRPLAKSSNASR